MFILVSLLSRIFLFHFSFLKKKVFWHSFLFEGITNFFKQFNRSSRELFEKGFEPSQTSPKNSIFSPFFERISWTHFEIFWPAKDSGTFLEVEESFLSNLINKEVNLNCKKDIIFKFSFELNFLESQN